MMTPTAGLVVDFLAGLLTRLPFWTSSSSTGTRSLSFLDGEAFLIFRATNKKVQGDAQIERDAEARIDADYELAARMTQEEQEKYTIEEKARLLAEFFERRKK
ncbi:hypothetical protein Tco_1076733 [Tanacetum coccineum]